MPLVEDTVTIKCRAGHDWTIERPRRGKWPEYCPQHKRFFLEPLSGRLKPPMTTRQEWAEQGKMLDDDSYTERWTKFWTKTVRMVGAIGSSWNKVDVDRINTYVRAVRMTELHRLYAQDQPYISTAHGSVKPHPGFELAKESGREAERLAVGLGLADATPTVEPSQPAPKRRPEVVEDRYQGRLQTEAEDVGDVDLPTGPDGEVL